jgi:glutamine synthetase
MALNCTTAEEVVRTIKDKNVQMADLRFTDLPCTWQHFSVPPSAVDADAMSDGIGFDGSSIRSFQEIQESDMLVVPDPTHVHQLIEQRLSPFLVYARYGPDDF